MALSGTTGTWILADEFKMDYVRKVILTTSKAG